MSENSPPDESKTGEKKYWLDEQRNVDRLVHLFYGLCALLVAVDVFVPKHGPFAIEHYFGFYAVMGFVACAGIILGAKALRRILMRPEDYYDR